MSVESPKPWCFRIVIECNVLSTKEAVAMQAALHALASVTSAINVTHIDIEPYEPPEVDAS